MPWRVAFKGRRNSTLIPGTCPVPPTALRHRVRLSMPGCCLLALCCAWPVSPLFLLPVLSGGLHICVFEVPAPQLCMGILEESWELQFNSRSSLGKPQSKKHACDHIYEIPCLVYYNLNCISALLFLIASLTIQQDPKNNVSTSGHLKLLLTGISLNNPLTLPISVLHGKRNMKLVWGMLQRNRPLDAPELAFGHNCNF